jgi:hypothetical protein
MQTIIFETWDRYRHWESKVKVALALLELRGPEQFKRERGGQLYLQARAQIVSTSLSSISSLEFCD